MKLPHWLLVIAIVFGIIACDRKKDNGLTGRVYSGIVFGKSYTIDCVGDSSNYHTQIDSIIKVFEDQYNLGDPHSTLNRFNAFTRKDTVFSFIDSTRAFGIVYDLLRDLHSATLDYYDPTTSPLKREWFRVTANRIAQEPNLDSLFEFVGFDGAKVDLMEITEGDYIYKASHLRKADPRIELDLTNLARAVTLDQIADFLKSKNILQYRISCDRHIIAHGNVVDSLNINSLGLSTDSADQFVRLNNCAFVYKTAQDKPNMIDVTFGYPVDNEMAYVAVSAPSLAEAEAFSEAFMIMGLEKAGEYYTKNESSKIQSFIFYLENDVMRSASTEGFDQMLVGLQNANNAEPAKE